MTENEKLEIIRSAAEILGGMPLASADVDQDDEDFQLAVNRTSQLIQTVTATLVFAYQNMSKGI